MYQSRCTPTKAQSPEAAPISRNAAEADIPEVELDIDVEERVDLGVDVDGVVDAVTSQKPHFLDYDEAVPPLDLGDSFDKVLSFRGTATSAPMATFEKQQLSSGKNQASCTGGELKLDKKFEHDGEVSDFELAASGYTKKEFTQDDNMLHLTTGGMDRGTSPPKSNFVVKPKHFLDENPIPPDYMIEHELREHRSLDRNFERQSEHERSVSAGTSSFSGRCKSALERTPRERVKEPAQAFFESQQTSIPKGAAWTATFHNQPYSSLHGNLPPLSNVADLHEIDLGPKVECVYSLLSMLGSNDPQEMAKKFFELSRTPETCVALRRSGCIPLLVQMIHAAGEGDGGEETGVRKLAGMALHNVVHSHPDERVGRREAKVLRLLDQINDYCNFLKTLLQSGGEAIADDSERHPLAAMSSLMKVSFDEEHRHAMCELGALQAIPNLMHLDHAVHGPKPDDQCCNSLRRYALMALTNLTFGDENNKAFLCSQKLFMEALVAQLDFAPDDLLQVTASVLRNLSWRADANMKAVLNEIGTVTALARAAMKNKSENTLKAILSALWNLSAHCSTNKAEFCAVGGALAFIVDMLTYEGPSKTLKIIENAGGILRNVSSHIAVRENYRVILRERNCLSILLQQLKSESLTVVSNSCGTLWNLSARCPEDQKYLWDNGAVPMLRSLIHSKHSMIAEGSSSALKNLLNFRPSIQNQNQLDPIARSMGLKKLPTLNARKQKALEEQELGGGKPHAETCDNLDIVPTGSAPRANLDASAAMPRKYSHTARLTRSTILTKSESRDSVFSIKSDSAAYNNLLRSHSATDTNRKQLPPPQQAFHHAPRRTAFALENDDDNEPTEEQPIDYSVKYNEHAAGVPTSADTLGNDDDVASGQDHQTYQETDLDQPTDFSLRYAENQIESDADISPPLATDMDMSGGKPEPPELQLSEDASAQCASDPPARTDEGNEILLILEDSVKCYQTEDTPYVISNAASITDLRQTKLDEDNHAQLENAKPSPAVITSAKKQPHRSSSGSGSAQMTVTYGAAVAGSYTPEKPINYCEEGTPGYFSRYESLSSLDESPPNAQANAAGEEKQMKPNLKTDVQAEGHDVKACDTSVLPIAALNEPLPKIQDSSTNMNSAQETPLMFSRRSSMDSLVEEDVGPCDDKSSVVSDFSRLASGVISPSEIPDSPTQSMPQSPRRNSGFGIQPNAPNSRRGNEDSSRVRPLRSVFEDDLNTFHLENTPAQFSCATSLSNLSIVDDDVDVVSDINAKMQAQELENKTSRANAVSEGEEDEAGGNNDDLLLARCINMGMNHRSVGNNASSKAIMDEPKQYFTEDTPAAMRSKVGSNTDLSAISICSSNNLLPNKEEHIFKYSQEAVNSANRRSLTLSDDMSSNASESGVDILQQCIRDGMKKKPIAAKPSTNKAQPSGGALERDPIAMMRRGGDVLPGYVLPVEDELSKYGVEDSPCNFSVMSGLSNLTVGSSLVGPAVQLEETATNNIAALMEKPQTPNLETDTKASPADSHSAAEHTASGLGVLSRSIVKRDQCKQVQQELHDDSLSSLSIESEDDTNLLSQAIAAGCNRPKSNLGFSSTSGNKRSTSLSSSQPIPFTAPASFSVSNLSGKSERHQRKHAPTGRRNNGNDSEFSSVDSSDSNDNQSKSLLELCILTGMHKSRDTGTSSSARSSRYQLLGSRAKSSGSTQSNPNLKNTDTVPSGAVQTPTATQPHKPHVSNRHLRERERKDEKLLLECINTGISKKISNPVVGHNLNANGSGHTLAQLKQTEQLLNFAAINAVPKNVEATSAAAPGPCQQVAGISSTPANSSSAAPGVGNIITSTSTSINTNNNTNISTNTNTNTTSHTTFNETRNSSHSSFISREGITDASRNLPRAPLVAEGGRQSLANVQEIANGTGCNESEDSEASQSASYDNNNTTSDESNQSFIIETTVSLDHHRLIQENVSGTSEKHKDPDLMLKSVERLTLEFVSSAEQLRTNSNACSESSDSQKRRDSISVCGAATNSNNTWNEGSCPNDVSFPSVSVSAPVIASLQDDDDSLDNDEQATEADHRDLHDFAEITPTNEEQPQPSIDYIVSEEALYGVTQPNSLETETDTLINEQFPSCYNSVSNSTTTSGINFKLGGEVQSAAALSRHMFLNGGINAMTNSTMIAFEARALADNLQQQRDTDDSSEMTFSLDLDHIRPPSGMESLNMSGCYQEHSMNAQPNSLHRSSFLPHSPLLSTKSPMLLRKSLPAGLVARRALGQLSGHLAGSMESVNSSCNLLDNIKPPSLMDELLDSMISVASIQSEVADCESLNTTFSLTSYETAAAGGEIYEIDDNTITLQSCYDTMPFDEDNEASLHSASTPLPTDNDFSSAESTPKKTSSSPLGIKRTLTPKQKRILSKDRFKTYTIAADNMLNAEQQHLLESAQQEEVLQIEILESSSLPQAVTPSSIIGGSRNKRRRSSEDRYRTQTIVYSKQLSVGDAAGDQINGYATSTDDCPSDNDLSSIRAMTKQFQYITAPVSMVRGDVAQPPRDTPSSIECDQSSETESCHGERQHSSETEGQHNTAQHEKKVSNQSKGRPSTDTAVALARIGTPTSTSPSKDANSKAIRGRKPAAYISPYSMQYQRNNPSATRSAINKALPTAGAAKAAQKRIPNAQVETSACKALAKVTLKKHSLEPLLLNGALAESTATQTPILERQGTFVKDEPTVTTTQVPVVTSSSAQSSPTRRLSRLPTKQQQQSPLSTPTTAGSGRKTMATTPGAKTPANIRRMSTLSKPQRSHTNGNLRATPSEARIAILSSRVSSTTPPSRSNSNINSTTAAKAAKTAAAKINQAQSRIANIWKRVDEARSRQHRQQPQQVPQQNKLQRTPTPGTRETHLSTQQTKSSSPLQGTQKGKLVRSSTYDYMPTTPANTNTNTGAHTHTAAVGATDSPKRAIAATSKIALNRNFGGAARKENLVPLATKK